MKVLSLNTPLAFPCATVYEDPPGSDLLELLENGFLSSPFSLSSHRLRLDYALSPFSEIRSFPLFVVFV